MTKKKVFFYVTIIGACLLLFVAANINKPSAVAKQKTYYCSECEGKIVKQDGKWYCLECEEYLKYNKSEEFWHCPDCEEEIDID